MMPAPKRRGRPRLDPAGRPSTPVLVRLAEDTFDVATKAATLRRESIQDLIRRGLRRELARR
jgi:hypothetical protein